MSGDVFHLLPSRTGHFRLESGHHGELWLDLELLCLDPAPVRRLAEQLAQRLAPHGVEAVCGPLVEGAFVALMVAAALAVPFTYANRRPDPDGPCPGRLYPVDYRIPEALRAAVRGKRVAIVNDVVNAGSAVRGTFTDLERCGAVVAAIGTLAVLGDWAPAFATDNRVPLETLACLPNRLWTPADCPLCATRVPLDATVESTSTRSPASE